MAPRKAKDCSNMEEVRAEIDRIDQALVDLIGERFTFVDRAWQLKQSPAEARVPWRIQQVIDRVRTRAAEKGLPPELAEALWRQMIGWFIQYEEEKLRQQLDERQRSSGLQMDAKTGEGQSHRRRDRPLGGGDRHGGACPGHLQRQAVLGRLDRVRRRAQQPCEPGRCRHARHAAGDQRGLHRASHPHRARAEGEDQSQFDLRPEELFLSRPAAGLSDQPVQEPDRRRGRGHRRSLERRARHGRHRAAASRAGRGQKPARPAPAIFLCRSQPLGRGVDGDRVEARFALVGAGARLCEQAPHHHALSRHLRRQYGAGLAARRRQCLGAPPGRAVRHALRDQERQLDPLHRPGHRI